MPASRRSRASVPVSSGAVRSMRRHLQTGNVVIPKSVTPSRIRENIDVFDFELDAGDLEAVAGLNSDTRLGADPDTMNWVG